MNKEKIKYTGDNSFQCVLLNLVLSALVAIAFFLLIFVVLLCLGCTTSQAAWIGVLFLTMSIIGLPGILIAFSVVGVILLFLGIDIEQVVSIINSFLEL